MKNLLTLLTSLALLGVTNWNCSGGGEDCIPNASTTCTDGAVYWVDSCGTMGAKVEDCPCGCTFNFSGCESPCDCTPSCAGKQCGSDGCGDNSNCGTCDAGWTCNANNTCVQPGTCNNGELETYEECEGFDLRGQTCETQGYDGGSLACSNTCVLDFSGCRLCGNDIREPGEVCDGTDLGGETCVSQGYGAGNLTCSPDCFSFLFFDCDPCGNGVVDTGEACDGTNLDGKTCQSLGHTDGTLACAEDCDIFDRSGCSGYNCDDSLDCDQCTSCALSNICVEALQACLGEPECGDYGVCLRHCTGDIGCETQCGVDYPNGQPLHDAMMDCINCGACYNDCDGASLGCP